MRTDARPKVDGDGAGEGPAPGAAERGGQAGGGENPAQNGQQARAAGLLIV